MSIFNNVPSSKIKRVENYSYYTNNKAIIYYDHNLDRYGSYQPFYGSVKLWNKNDILSVLNNSRF